MFLSTPPRKAETVALRKESVDRNSNPLEHLRSADVALRKESVDRNDVIRPAIDVFLASLSARRAWIEIPMTCQLAGKLRSLSARRAWIEISDIEDKFGGLVSLSARRAWIEIDDISGATKRILRSLSARRAWIEITTYLDTSSMDDVALRKESVDRNFNALQNRSGNNCRSPQGERG